MTDSTTTPALDLEACESLMKSPWVHPANHLYPTCAALIAEIRSLREEVAKLKAAPPNGKVLEGL